MSAVSIVCILPSSSCVEFIHALIHCPKATDAIHLFHSKLPLVHTTITECVNAVVAIESDLRLTNCVIDSWSPTIPGLSMVDSKFEAKKTSCLSRSGRRATFARSKGTIEDCLIKRTCGSGVCLEIFKDSHVFIRTSTVSDFQGGRHVP